MGNFKYTFNYLINNLLKIALFIGLSYILFCSENDINKPDDEQEGKAVFWLTSPIQKIYFTKQTSIEPSNSVENQDSIVVNSNESFQEIDGFGFALTGGSAYHIHNMSASARSDLLTELFSSKDTNIGTSYLRVSIGASDLDFAPFSYDDLEPGETDINMEKFSLDKDREHVIPVLKEILEINPDIKILGSPWSAPIWMKTNGNSIGGRLKAEYHEAYAKYFVKYIQGMRDEGITIDAITVQNEPLHDGNNPSMYMPASQQGVFVKDFLGPAFEDAAIQTKIIIYDHNADNTAYALSILADPSAAQYINGSAFHLYNGAIGALSMVHNAFPEKNLYFTEQWVGANQNMDEVLKWHIRELIVGATRNWCKTVIEWNLASDPNYEPHTEGGCSECLGAVTINGDQIIRNPAYYIIAHASKYVRPGSHRIDSTLPENLPNVAFKRPDGKIVVIVLNNGFTEKSFSIKIGNECISSSLASGAVGTYVW
ncbi:MAG: glycoside hydrolase family 30 beta sandwich domain-containing protein [Calditrichaceae bacterium]